MQLHGNGDQFSDKNLNDIINSFNSIKEQYLKEYQNAKDTYESSGSVLLANKAMLGNLSLGLDFMIRGEQMIIETHRQLANAIGAQQRFKEVYKT